ncbi:abortive infection family protein [Niallia sp. Sow4_A1]|uniref:Abortive infection family protein n=1 Tax=Niallia hominis TaxID=3133173 RepID=A0ABV1EXE7_9BACI|nr:MULTISPECIES: abortive infection family protein [Bacillaceae]MCF2646759.1 abortive infection family protein [Niallia circulans]CAI9397012.1 hypothetical protein BACSP_01390 [Bacillus sp. T2.9-1]
MFEELFYDVESLKRLLVSKATGGQENNSEYTELRQKLLNNGYTKAYLPHFLRTCRSLNDFWNYIKEKSTTYQGRRDYLRIEFEKVLMILEDMTESEFPIDEVVSFSKEDKLDLEYVQQAWQKALDRRTNDPEGAITIARTLLEATCKHIMDDANIEYDDKSELPQLYKGVQKVLNLAPSEHTEQIFKEILSGCVSVVKGLGSIRNKLSDAHGKGQRVPTPSARHAHLAVNLAGAMASFLVSSWEEKRKIVG